MQAKGVDAGERVLGEPLDRSLQARREVVLEAWIARLAAAHAGRRREPAHRHQLPGEGGEQTEEGQPFAHRVLGAGEPPLEPRQRLARTPGRDRVENLPDVLLAAVLDLRLDLGKRDGAAAGEGRELAILGAEAFGRVGVDLALAAAPALGAQRPARELDGGLAPDRRRRSRARARRPAARARRHVPPRALESRPASSRAPRRPSVSANGCPSATALSTSTSACPSGSPSRTRSASSEVSPSPRPRRPASTAAASSGASCSRGSPSPRALPRPRAAAKSAVGRRASRRSGDSAAGSRSCRRSTRSRASAAARARPTRSPAPPENGSSARASAISSAAAARSASTPVPTANTTLPAAKSEKVRRSATTSARSSGWRSVVGTAPQISPSPAARRCANGSASGRSPLTR